MSDLAYAQPDDQENAPATTPTMHPDMQNFADQPWPDGARDWANETAIGINDQMQRERIAAGNAAAAQAFQSGINRFANGLVSWVSGDPTRADAAIREVRPFFDNLIGNNPNHPDDQRAEHHEALSSDLEGRIAHAAISSMADMHAGQARDMLGGDLGNYLDDGQKQYLGAYISAQDMARGVDAAGQQQMLQRAAARRDTMAALGHASQLYDPQTDTLQFPQAWAQNLTANQNIDYPDKARLMHLYGRMQSSGDAPASDPVTVNNTLQQIAQGNSPDHGPLIDAAGQSLRLADALHLMAGTGPLTVDQRNHYGNLADTVQQARDVLYGRDGENGAAGHAAWGRYVNWLLPAARQGADFGDPEAHPLNWLPRFRPSGDEVIGQINGSFSGWNRYHMWQPDNAWAGVNRVAPPSGGDEVIQEPRGMPAAMPTIKDVNPGSGLGVPEGGWDKRAPRGIEGAPEDGKPPLRLTLGQIFGRVLG